MSDLSDSEEDLGDFKLELEPEPDLTYFSNENCSEFAVSQDDTQLNQSFTVLVDCYDEYVEENGQIYAKSMLDQMEWFKCEHCDFQDRIEENVEMHVKHCPNWLRNLTEQPTNILEQPESPENNPVPEKSEETFNFKERPKRELFKCDVCNFTTRRPESFKQHEQAHLVEEVEKPKPITPNKSPGKSTAYKCGSCIYSSGLKARMLKHQKVRHGNQNTNTMIVIQNHYIYRCNECNYQTTNASRFRAHQSKSQCKTQPKSTSGSQLSSSAKKRKLDGSLEDSKFKTVQSDNKAKRRKLDDSRRPDSSRKVNDSRKLNGWRKLNGSRKLDDSRNLVGSKQLDDSRKLDGSRKLHHSRKLPSSSKLDVSTKLEDSRNFEGSAKLEDFEVDPKIFRVRCDLCGLPCKNNTNLDYHQIDHLTTFLNGYHQCNKCAFYANTKNKIRKHLAAHRRKKLSILHKQFLATLTPKEQVDRSKSKHSPNQNRSKCHQCDFASRTSEPLQQHQCPRAEVKVEAVELKKEKAVKSDTKPAVSCTLCNFTARYPSSLRRHQNTVHKSPSKVHKVDMAVFKCSHCIYTSPYKQVMQRHQNVHSVKHKRGNKSANQSDLKCPQCAFVCRSRSGLSNHQKRVHTPEGRLVSYNCDTCPFRTKYCWNLKKHTIACLNRNKKMVQR